MRCQATGCGNEARFEVRRLSVDGGGSPPQLCTACLSRAVVAFRTEELHGSVSAEGREWQSLVARGGAFVGSSVDFARIVAGALASGVDPVLLAVEFEVAVSTVLRWADETARPHPRIQRLVVDWIRRRMLAEAKKEDGMASGKKTPRRPPASVGERLRLAEELIEAFCGFTGSMPLRSGHAGEVNEAYARWREAVRRG